MLTISSATASTPTAFPACIPYDGFPPPRPLPAYHPSYSKDPLPLPPTTPRGAPAWNRLEWPVWGLSRFAEMHMLLPGDDWIALSAQLDADRSVVIAFDDEAGGSGTVLLRIVDAVPVADTRATPSSSTSGADEVLYALTLTDERYAWADNTYSPDTLSLIAPTSWGSLLSSLIESATGVTISSTTIDADLTAAGSIQYPQPQPLFASHHLHGRSASVLADAVAAALNVRILVVPNGTAGSVSVQTWATAASTNDTSWVPDLCGGGFRTKPPAGTITVTQYGTDGIIDVFPVAVVGATSTRSLAVWLPHNGTGRSRWVTDYTAWAAQELPDASVAGLTVPPPTSLIDRWVLDHDAGVTGLFTDWADYPWPLIGLAVTPSALPRFVELCVVKNVDGLVTDVRVTRLQPDDSITCDVADECPTCEE